MTLSDLNDLDFSNAGSWPPLIKGIAIILLIAAVGAAGYWFDAKDLLQELERAQLNEIQLKEEFKRKQEVMANINDYRKQLEELQALLDTMLKQLPTRTEMPDLLEDVSNTGKINGLTFELFKPESEQPRDFYAAKPISIKARGSYHQFAAFVSSVAALPRIVTLESASLSESPSRGASDVDDDTLQIEAKLQTYRYLEADESGDGTGQGN